MRQPHLSRRALLAGGAAVAVLAGCSTPEPEPVRDTPEEALARALIAEKERTVALYSAPAAGGGKAAAYRDRHAAHLAELRRRYPRLTEPTPASSTVSASAPVSATPTPTQKMTLARLRALDRRAAARRPAQLAGVAPALAQLVASIGACEALHAGSAVKRPAAPAARAAADPGDVAKLRKALSAEHAAVFAFGLLAARTTGSLRTRLTRAFDAHRDRRDELRRLITARGGQPAEPHASYALPSVPSTGPAASRLAAHVENGLTASYLELVAAVDPALRRYAAVAMQEAVMRAHSFRPSTVAAFPGLPAPAPAPSPAVTPSG
ncbi:MAG TPA: ferritin-like domain-containing protein [Nonomuraea sp.]|nr:ferritin-like domain-containing protein [Nonomuraea sp.]